MKAIYIIRYNEIGLKGGNRSFFENALIKHIQKKLKHINRISLFKTRGRIFIEGDLIENREVIHKALSQVPGIHSFSLGEKLPLNIDLWKSKALTLFNNKWNDQLHTFRISSKRSDKNFHMNSNEINAEIGAHIIQNSASKHLSVSLKSADINIALEIHPEHAVIYLGETKAMGGLPMGSAGRVLCLLSGGLDSPVAAYQMMRRGCQVHYVFFENKVFLGRAAFHKVEKLANILSQYQYPSQLYVVPFTDIQVQIRDQCNPKYRVILYRRFMYRIAEQILQKNNFLGLVTGESLGQVASQTLENLRAVNCSINACVYRPLISSDKQDIMDLAKHIGTYNISIEDAPDCCSVFMPKRPVTRAQLEQVEKDEQKLDVTSLEREAILQTETIRIPN